ncbi:MAG: antitoxin family protein [Gemmataceae bacterium]
MIAQPLTVEAVFEDGVFRPVAPVPLAQHQRVRITVSVAPAARAWPDDVAEIYRELADDDRRLATGMVGDIRATWPAGESS